MNIIKGLANALLGFLLFLCLTVLGAALTLNMTVLNSSFMTSQLDKLDAVAIAEEVIIPEIENIQELSSHPEIITSIKNTLVKHTSEVKAKVNIAINDIYAYLVHGQTLDLKQTLQKSLLDPQLATSIIQDIDLSLIVDDLLRDIIPAEGPGGIPLTPYIDDIAPVVEPWLKGQLPIAVPSIYDYILGKRADLNLIIPLATIEPDIRVTLKQAFLKEPPAVLASLSQAELSQQFDTFYAEIAHDLPASLAIDTASLGIGAPAEIDQALKRAEEGLRIARIYIGYYQTGFWLLVGLTLILILSIILVNRDMKGNARTLGGIFATYGILEAVGILISRSIVHRQLVALPDVPSSIQPWLVQLGDSLFHPLLIFAVICAVTGIGLLVVSFVYKPRQA